MEEDVTLGNIVPPSTSQQPTEEIELDLLPQPIVVLEPPTIHWHPKVTVSRLLAILTTLSLGIAKAATTYRGGTVVPITIEWVTGVILFIIFFIFSNVEIKENAWPKWFFKKDLLPFLWQWLRKRFVRVPVYETDERDLKLLVKPNHPPVTGYRILVTASVLGFGLLKATLSYQGRETAPTTVEWVFGVVVTISLYWIGLYEASSTNVFPAFFEVDYSEQLVKGGFTLGLVFVHLAVLGLVVSWTSVWGWGIYELWQPDSLPPDAPVPPPKSRTEEIATLLFKLVWTIMASILGVGVGTIASCFIFYRVVVLVGPFLLDVGIWSLEKVFGLIHRIRYGHTRESDDVDDATLVEEEGWLSKMATRIEAVMEVLANPSAPVEIIYVGMLWLLIAIGYVVAHAVALLVTSGWTGLWLYGLYSLWTMKDTTWFLWGFRLIWSCGAVFAVGVGTYGILAVIWAFFSIVTGKHSIFS